nr:MAG TPA: portal protein [Caudoviricetes sp.]
MEIIAAIKGWWKKMFFKSDAKRIFDVDILLSDTMDMAIRTWNQIYAGHPNWVDKDNHVKTINFAKSVSSETARLACLDLSIKVSGSARAVYLQSVIDNMFGKIREYVERGCVNGTIILKPNGDGIDCFDPQRFLPTEVDGNGNIRAGIFFDFYEQSKKYYKRLEYHRFADDGVYLISNRCFISESSTSLGTETDITKTPWKELMPDVGIENIEKPLFAVFKTPMANNIDIASPLGMSIFAEAMEELKDLDVAYSRNAKEIYDSKRTVLADERLFDGKAIMVDGEIVRVKPKMPDYIRNVLSEGQENFYQEINPNLNTDTRVKGMNNILSILAYKCGYSNGYFSFDSMTGIQTATGVEASQQRTIQFIKDVRDKLEMTMDDLIYAIDKYADLYDLSPVGVYEVEYGFGDICYNYEEDKKTWWGYVQAGKVPAWMYFVKFENMSEDEAKAMQAEIEAAEAEKQQGGLFGEE